MSESNKITFRNLATQEEADEIVELLAEKDIPATCTKDSGDLDYVFQGERPTNKFEIQINEEDRLKAESVMIELAAVHLEEVDPDYYLFSFSDEELMDILIKNNEWNEFDVLLSEKILGERGVEIDKSAINKKQEIRELQLAEPEGGQTGWIIVGYVSALLGGVLGLIIGYFIWQAKNKLPNGKKVYAYNETVRKHGLVIFLISAVIFPIVIIIRIATEIKFFSS